MLLAERTISGALVLDDNGGLLGVLTLADIERIPTASGGECRIEGAINREMLLVQLDKMLDVALEQLTSYRVGWMPVMEIETALGGRRVVGRVLRSNNKGLSRGTS